MNRNEISRVVLGIFSVALLCSLGCGEQETSPLLDEDVSIRFQELPALEDGNLIPQEEIPVISVEMTRQDDEFFWWRLKAEPVPTREDLVVSVYAAGPYLSFYDFNPTYLSIKAYKLIVIRKNQNGSKEFKAPLPKGEWVWRRTRGGFYRNATIDGTHVYLWHTSNVEEDWNTEEHWVIKEEDGNQSYIPLQEVPLIELSGNLYHVLPADMSSRYTYTWEWGAEAFEVIVFSPEKMFDVIISKIGYDAPFSTEYTFAGRPPLLTNDGYVIPSDFLFSYYFVGDGLSIRYDKEQPERPEHPPAEQDEDEDEDEPVF